MVSVFSPEMFKRMQEAPAPKRKKHKGKKGKPCKDYKWLGECEDARYESGERRCQYGAGSALRGGGGCKPRQFVGAYAEPWGAVRNRQWADDPIADHGGTYNLNALLTPVEAGAFGVNVEDRHLQRDSSRYGMLGPAMPFSDSGGHIDFSHVEYGPWGSPYYPVKYSDKGGKTLKEQAGEYAVKQGKKYAKKIWDDCNKTGASRAECIRKAKAGWMKFGGYSQQGLNWLIGADSRGRVNCRTSGGWYKYWNPYCLGKAAGM